MSRGNIVWFNGALKDEKTVQVSLFSHALHYGTGAFEGIRAYEQTDGSGAIFRLQEHMERLRDSIRIMGLEIPYTPAQLSQAAIDTCKANNFKECYIRPLAYIGDSGLGVHPGNEPKIDVTLLTWKWGNYLGDRGVTEGAKLMCSTFIRPHVNSIMTKAKITGHYVTGSIAKMEAKRLGFDEALMLDKDGFLTEGTGENLFIIKNGKIKTTPLTSILNGITRNTVMQLAQELGYTVEEQRFTRDELWCADEIFLTGTAAEITPVSSVDLRLIGPDQHRGKPGPISLKVKKYYADVVRGKGSAITKEWLSKI